jgi:hypothetical protein
VKGSKEQDVEALMTLVVVGSVAAVAIPLAALLEWWSVRAVLALAAAYMRPKPRSVIAVAQVPSAAGGLT